MRTIWLPSSSPRRVSVVADPSSPLLPSSPSPYQRIETETSSLRQLQLTSSTSSQPRQLQRSTRTSSFEQRRSSEPCSVPKRPLPPQLPEQVTVPPEQRERERKRWCSDRSAAGSDEKGGSLVSCIPATRPSTTANRPRNSRVSPSPFYFHLSIVFTRYPATPPMPGSSAQDAQEKKEKKSGGCCACSIM